MTARLGLHALRHTIRLADQLDATVPKKTRTEYDRLLDLADRASTIDTTNDVPGAVLAALEAGRDPSTDPAVIAQVAIRVIADTRPALDVALAIRAQAFAVEHADTLLEAFRRPFDAAVVVITDAVQAGAPRPFGAAQEADRSITLIQQTWKLLAGVAPHLAVDTRYWPLTIADIPPASFIDDNLASPGRPTLTAWAAAHAGYRLSLATPTTLADRVAAVYAEIHERQRQHVQAEQDALHRRYGHGTGPQAA